MLRRTPCIGTCSTTYGDLVCRGCKRFAHEIVQWNGFDQEQRRTVWSRLLMLRAGAVQSVVEVRDEHRLREHAGRLGLTKTDELDTENLLYELLQRLQWRDPDLDVLTLGLSLSPHASALLEGQGAPPHELGQGRLAPQALLALIDREFYRRSVAQYERNYRIPAE